MAARPTPGQRAVLEAMNAPGTSLVDFESGLLVVSRPNDDGISFRSNHRLVANLLAQRWIQAAPNGRYVITEAGRRAVAHSNGGV